MKNKSYLISSLLLIAAGSLTACDSSSGSTIIDHSSCQAGLVLCGEVCCAEGSCDENNVCHESDADSCGESQEKCGDNQVCSEGKCVAIQESCKTGQKICKGSCVNIQSDAKNCGDCENACETGQTCNQGKCESSCSEGYTLIDGQCYDTRVDSEHCGEYLQVCGDNQYCAEDSADKVIKCMCMDGFYDCDNDSNNGCESTTACEFVCSEGQKSCGSNLCCNESDTCCGSSCCQTGTTCCPDSSCADLNNDVQNCGTCGNTCGKDHICQEGVCIISCSDTQTACGDICTDLKSDNQNCGECGKVCASNEQCVTENEVTLCKLTSEITPELQCTPPEEIECWGKCVQGQTDPENCGECGNQCNENQICKEGTCTNKPSADDCENPAETRCYGQCVDLSTDNNNCGECLNTCSSGYKCEAGTCTLQCGELTNCNNTCIDIQNSANNCGECGKKCADGQSCVGGTCQCSEGRYDCDGDPANGCESTTTCACTPGTSQPCWRGEPENRGKGICQDGTQVCDASGQFWGTCTGGVYPSPITCGDNGIYLGGDQNCNDIDDTQEECVSNCDIIRAADSYIGCEYWPVYLANQPDYPNYLNHTVLISNPNTEPVTVYIYKPSEFNSTPPKTSFKFNVEAGQVKVQTLSTNTSYMVDGTGITSQSYYLRSSLPVTVYQFTPWDGSYSYTADASLLLPTNVLGQNYRTLTWSPGYTSHTSNTTIVAVRPGKTKVTVTMNAPIIKGGNVQAFNAKTTKEFSLDRFQVLNLVTSQVDGEQTGSLISADQPIAVYGGMRCSNIPHGYGACDHLEEQMIPIHAWGKSYFAVPVERRGNSPDIWRILANENDTTVTLPANLGGTKKLNAGEFYQIETKEMFEVSADKPILVGQFLVGQSYMSAGKGDPAFGLAVPYEQYRTDYSFSVPSSYNENYITIIVPNDGRLYYDNVELSTAGFKAIGTTGFKYAYKKVTAGAHTMTGDKAFGLIGYGYSPYISYLYPIGLDLKHINDTN